LRIVLQFVANYDVCGTKLINSEMDHGAINLADVVLGGVLVQQESFETRTI